MKTLKLLIIVLLALGVNYGIIAQTNGYNIGDTARDFELPNVDGNQVSLSGMDQAKGAIIIFSCNTCPVVKAYEDRMISLHEKYAPKGYPVIAINSNDQQVSPGDSFEAMKKRAKDKNFPFYYVYDKSQEVIKDYGGTRTPHVYLLNKENGEFIVKYIGAIDNNQRDADAVTEPYLENAVESILRGEKISVETTKAIGCGIKWSKSE
ncbi:thioredoxin family protein [Echinicola sediminis]